MAHVLRQVMRQKIDSKSSAQGFPESRLPQFTEEEQQMILGSRLRVLAVSFAGQPRSTVCYLLTTKLDRVGPVDNRPFTD